MPGRKKNKGKRTADNGSGQLGGPVPWQGQNQGAYPPPQQGAAQGHPPQQGAQQPYGAPNGGPHYASQPPAQKKSKLARNGCLGCGGLLALIIVIIIVVTVANQSSGSGSSNTSAANQSVSENTSHSSGSTKTPAAKKKKDQGSDAASKLNKTYGTFKPITKSGSSAAVISLPASAKGGIIKATYSGSSNFIISGLDSSNKPTADIGLPNAIGHYAGTTMFGDIDLGNRATKLKIEATGPWNVVISPVSDAPKFPSSGASGTGDAVYAYTGDATTMNVTNKGSSNFIVNQVGEGFSGAQINEIGNYTGQSAFVSGPQPLTINSDGPWTIKPTS